MLTRVLQQYRQVKYFACYFPSLNQDQRPREAVAVHTEQTCTSHFTTCFYPGMQGRFSQLAEFATCNNALVGGQIRTLVINYLEKNINYLEKNIFF